MRQSRASCETFFKDCLYAAFGGLEAGFLTLLHHQESEGLNYILQIDMEHELENKISNNSPSELWQPNIFELVLFLSCKDCK